MLWPEEVLLGFAKCRLERLGGNPCLEARICSSKCLLSHRGTRPPNRTQGMGICSPAWSCANRSAETRGTRCSDISLCSCGRQSVVKQEENKLLTAFHCTESCSIQPHPASSPSLCPSTDMLLCWCHGYGEEKVKINDTSATPSNQTLAVVGVFRGRLSLGLLVLVSFSWMSITASG